MSSPRGAEIAGKRRCRVATISRGVVDRQRRLGQEGEVVRIGRHGAPRHRRPVSISVIVPSGTWPNVPITSGWPAWPMKRMCRPASISRSAWRWTLRDQRAGRVEIVEPARLGFGGHRLGHAVGGEHHRHAVGHLVELVDEHRALGLQAVDDEAVVDDLVADIDRRAIALERQLDDRIARSTPAQKPRGAAISTCQRRVLLPLAGAILCGALKGAFSAAATCGKAASSGCAANGTDKKRGWSGTSIPPDRQLESADHQMPIRPPSHKFAALGAAGHGDGAAQRQWIDIEQRRRRSPRCAASARRSACPIQTGDVTLFDPATQPRSSAIDVVAAITNVQPQCDDERRESLYQRASFDVLATAARRRRGARTVQLPYFATVVRGGTAVIAKRVGTVTYHFAEGQDARARRRARRRPMSTAPPRRCPPEIQRAHHRASASAGDAGRRDRPAQPIPKCAPRWPARQLRAARRLPADAGTANCAIQRHPRSVAPFRPARDGAQVLSPPSCKRANIRSTHDRMTLFTPLSRPRSTPRSTRLEHEGVLPPASIARAVSGRAAARSRAWRSRDQRRDGAGQAARAPIRARWPS